MPDEPSAVTRLRELARNALALEEIRTFEGQDADQVLAYIDQIREQIEDDSHYIQHLNEFNDGDV